LLVFHIPHTAATEKQNSNSQKKEATKRNFFV